MTIRLYSLVVLPWLVACGGAEPPPPETAPPPPPTSAAPALGLGAPSAPEPPPPSVAAIAQGAVQLDNLGSYHKAVTASPDAQKWFDQGLRLTYGFNHDEAARSFAKAADIDPSCAMCFWGVALVMGPNYNMPMQPEHAQAAWDALKRAREVSENATPLEQALVVALGRRYKGPEPVDPAAMQPLSEAYAAAMRDVTQHFPDDLDVSVLFAEALMDVNPWKLWSLDGKPAPGTEEIVSRLDAVLAKNPSHPGANHYLIHAVEASPHPEKAVPSAERLQMLMPGAGHIVHMPAHIFQRVGRYAEASEANAKAVEADLLYIHMAQPKGSYPMYLAHNYGFLAFSTSMEGRSADCIAAARNAAKSIPPEMMSMMPGMDFFASAPALAMVRFGKWDELLAEPKPDAKYPVLTAFWLHGHGMAAATKGKFDVARADLDALAKLRDGAPADLRAGQNAAKDVFAVAAKVLEARITLLDKKAKPKVKEADMLALWNDAVTLADKLAYSEPDDWFYPVRHFQGAVLMGADKAADAEAVYREDLRRHPSNGWALFGLWKSLEKQKKAKDANEAKAQFEKAWSKSDVKLAASAF